MIRTNAQRRYARKGYRYEMIPLRPLPGVSLRYSYLLSPSADLRSKRAHAAAMGMVVREVCKPMIHNGRAPRR